MVRIIVKLLIFPCLGFLLSLAGRHLIVTGTLLLMETVRERSGSACIMMDCIGRLSGASVSDRCDWQGELTGGTVIWVGGCFGEKGINSHACEVDWTVCCRLAVSILLPNQLGWIPSGLNKCERSQNRSKLLIIPNFRAVQVDWSQVWRLRSLLKRLTPRPREGMGPEK